MASSSLSHPEVAAARGSLSGPSSPLTEAASALKAEDRLGPATEVSLSQGAIEVRRRDALVVLFMGEELARAADPLVPYLERLSDGRAGVLFVGQPPAGLFDALPKRVIAALVPEDPDRNGLFLAVDGLLERVDLRARDERKGRRINRYRYELGELVDIARALTQERDIDRLLGLILERSRFITGADAGSIYVVEHVPGDANAEGILRFKLSQNDSCAFESSEFTMPVSTRSIAGYAVVTKKPINIMDVYAIADDAPYGFDRRFDERVGYRTCSMMTVPLISAEDAVIGVIQLINRKRDPEEKLKAREDFDRQVIPFDARSEELIATLASQAGIALENALLYDEIKRIFEGFVRASVQAIEQRDPTTSGHSLRVSVLSCRLAEMVDRIDAGPYAEASFTRRDIKELEYASLLHDFGKIGVREKVLVKAKKLYPDELAAVRERIYYAREAAALEVTRRKLEAVQAGAGGSDLRALDEELRERTEKLDEAWRFIEAANEPTVMKEGDFTRVTEVGGIAFVDGAGERRTLLTPEEIACLQVTRGSLNTVEIDEIRSHVVHTFNFLARIPWGRSFARIPGIAGAHHEKLDGSGYPNGILAEAIPLRSKIMTVADIYDALTARDRPYKKAIPVERAFDILGFEVKDGHIDPELVRIFREAEVYRVVEQEELRY